MRGISQMKLAELCDSSTGYIGQIEIGNKFPSIEMIGKLSSALSIKPYMLFLDESDEEKILQTAQGDPGYVPKSETDELIFKLTAAVRQVVKQYYSP